MPITEEQRQLINEKSDLAEKNASKLNNGARVAISIVLGNMLNGCFWGFTDTSFIKAHEQAIKDNADIILRRLNDDNVLVEVNPKLVIESLQEIDENAFTMRDKNDIVEAQKLALCDFEKYLIDKGKLDTTFEGKVGIYCINKVSCITLKGKYYRAFRLNINQVLDLLNRYGYLIKLNGKYVEPIEVIRRKEELFRTSAIFSPSKTGVFIDIKYNETKELMLELEKKFLIKYNKMKES